MKCYSCSGIGHSARDCPESGKSDRGRPSQVRTYLTIRQPNLC
jgi:hypothetical protein